MTFLSSWRRPASKANESFKNYSTNCIQELPTQVQYSYCLYYSTIHTVAAGDHEKLLTLFSFRH